MRQRLKVRPRGWMTVIAVVTAQLLLGKVGKWYQFAIVGVYLVSIFMFKDWYYIKREDPNKAIVDKEEYKIKGQWGN